MTMMNIVYIGRFYPRNLLNDLMSDSKIGFSNHNFEMSIINGLSQQEIDLTCMTVPGVYSFPYNNKRIYTRSETYKYQKTTIISVGFCNLPVIKEVWSTIALLINLIKLIYRCKGSTVHIIINTPNNGLLRAVRLAKFLTSKKITQTVIIPDIPSMITSMDRQSFIKAILLHFRNKSSMKMTSLSNGLVLLTEAMTDFIKKPLPYIVMEGIVDVPTMDLSVNAGENDNPKEIILYTGTLRKIFGIMNLIEAFKRIDSPNVELWLCGSGDAHNDIVAAAKIDSRIKFYGLVSSQTALQLQNKATILVNPRTSDGEYTKYSFPSKTMEYLLSGKTTIINILPGIPEEYYKYVYTPKNESIDALAECISAVLKTNKEVRREKSAQGREFILTCKNSKIQTLRILDMIREY